MNKVIGIICNKYKTNMINARAIKDAERNLSKIAPLGKLSYYILQKQ